MSPPPRSPGRRDRTAGVRDERIRRTIESQHAASEASRAVLAVAAARRDADWREAARDNRRRALIATASPLLLGVLLMALGVVALAFLVAGALLTILWSVVALRLWHLRASRVVGGLGGLSMADAAARGLISPGEAERMTDVTEGLCAALGLTVPALAIIDGQTPNALALGCTPDDATLVLTTGVPRLLNRIELEAVVAHELTHVKRRDTLTATIAATGLGAAGDLLSGGRFSIWLVGEDRELRTDMAAVGVTRYPPGLISALERNVQLERTVTTDDPRAGRRVELSWLAPVAGPADRPGRRPQSELHDRLDVLREL